MPASGPNIEDWPILSDPEPTEDSPAETDPQIAAPQAATDPQEQELASARDNAEEAADEGDPFAEFSEHPAAEDDLAVALSDIAESDETDDGEPASGEDDESPAQVGAVLRRRRRRRR